MESRATITTEINATFPDNNSKFITAEKVRAFMDIINASKFNLVDDELGNLIVDTVNNLTLNQVLNQIYTEVNNNTDLINDSSVPLFYIEFRVYDSNGGNPISYVADLVSTNATGVSVSKDADGVNLNYDDLGENLRVVGGTAMNLTNTSCTIFYPEPEDARLSNVPEWKTKVYFFKDF